MRSMHEIDDSEICVIWWQHLDVEVSIRFNGVNYLIQSEDSGQQQMYKSLLEAIESLEGFYSTSEGEVVVYLRDEGKEAGQEILNVFFSNPLSSRPLGKFADAQYSGGHVLELNGELYQALLINKLNLKITRIDPSTELIDMTILARYSETEYQSHGSTWATWILARLSDQSIVWLCDEDELDGFSDVKSEIVSDLEAVKNWLPSIEARGDCFLGQLALALFENGDTVCRGSELNPSWSESLEMKLTFNLSEADLEELQRHLENLK